MSPSAPGSAPGSPARGRVHHRLRRPAPGPPVIGTGLRLLLRRRTRLRRTAAVLGAAVLTVAVTRWDRPPTGGAPPPSSPTGRPAPLAVADLAPGSVIGPDDVVWVELPPEVARFDGDPTGAVVTAPIGDGEVLVPGRVAAPAADGSPGPTGRSGLRPEERAVAVLPPAAPLPLDTGDVVELVAVRAAPDAASGVVTTRFDTTGRVLAVDDDAVTVALPADVAAEVVTHQAVGSIEVLLTPWSG